MFRTGLNNGFSYKIDNNSGPFKNTWTPLNFGTSLLAWWDPSSGVVKDPATNRISSWIDRKENIILSQAAGGAQPLWTATGINSRPAIYFDGVRSLEKTYVANNAEMLQLSQASSAGWFGVIKPDISGSSDTLLAVPPGIVTTLWLKLHDTTNNYIGINRTTNTGHFFSCPSSTSAKLLGATITGSTVYGHFNTTISAGAVIDTAVSGNVGLSFMVGQRRVGIVDADNLNGHVGDIFIFRTALTNIQKSLLAEWSRKKWGY